MKRLLLTALVVVGLLTVALPGAAMAAKGGNSATAHACQKGGWRDLVRPDNTRFAGQGACVRFGARGGTVVPAESSVFFTFAPAGPSHCFVTLNMFAFDADTTYDGTVLLNDTVTFPVTVVTDSLGDGATGLFSNSPGPPVSANIGGVTVPNTTIAC